MTNATRSPRRDAANMLAFCQSFARKEDGSVTILACFMILMMMIIGGIGVDMMRHEMERTRIQAVADRAVLAAADLDQQLDPEAVVRDYFAKSGMADFVSSVEVNEGVNFRTVTVDASTDINTMFMDFLGTDQLHVPAISTAQENVNKVEISLVLDISGSMRHNNKMPNLRDAAGIFLDTVLIPDTRNLVSISVIPYTAQVNAGEDIFNLLDIEQTHDYTHCVDFEDLDFSDRAIYFGESPIRPDPYIHMQHFDGGWNWPGWHNGEDTITNPGCPKQDFEEITAFSQDKDALKLQIDQFQPRANTSIHIGMKWGVGMLDPEWRKFNAVLPGVDPVFRNRPDDYQNPDNQAENETIKTVILMTDGQNVPTERIQDRVYAEEDHWFHWSKYPLNGYLNRYVRSSERWRWKYTKYSAAEADDMLEDICDAAKDRNIVIWTIAFEAPTHGENVMRNCASSQSHFFAVNGDEISDAFSSIANSINKLRLTQ